MLGILACQIAFCHLLIYHEHTLEPRSPRSLVSDFWLEPIISHVTIYLSKLLLLGVGVVLCILSLDTGL